MVGSHVQEISVQRFYLGHIRTNLTGGFVISGYGTFTKLTSKVPFKFQGQ